MEEVWPNTLTGDAAVPHDLSLTVESTVVPSSTGGSRESRRSTASSSSAPRKNKKKHHHHHSSTTTTTTSTTTTARRLELDESVEEAPSVDGLHRKLPHEEELQRETSLWRSIPAITIMVGVVVGACLIFFLHNEGSSDPRAAANANVAVVPRHIPAENGGRFSVFFGLRDTGLNATTTSFHTLETVEGLIVEWIETRLAQGLPVVSVALRSQTLVYPVGPTSATTEPGAFATGLVPGPIAKSLNEEEILDLLRNLTEAICTGLRQPRCFYQLRENEYMWSRRSEL